LDIGDGFAFGDADVSITFRPLETQLIVKGGAGFVPGNIFGDVGFAGLYDDTTGQTVLQFGPRILAPEYHVFVDLSHVYTIRATSEALPGAADLAGTRLSITSAPEAESVIVFLILGLGALAIVGRSRIIRPSKVLT
jgi:hypothetical protein